MHTSFVEERSRRELVERCNSSLFIKTGRWVEIFQWQLQIDFIVRVIEGNSKGKPSRYGRQRASIVSRGTRNAVSASIVRIDRYRGAFNNEEDVSLIVSHDRLLGSVLLINCCRYKEPYRTDFSVVSVEIRAAIRREPGAMNFCDYSNNPSADWTERSLINATQMDRYCLINDRDEIDPISVYFAPQFRPLYLRQR